MTTEQLKAKQEQIMSDFEEWWNGFIEHFGNSDEWMEDRMRKVAREAWNEQQRRIEALRSPFHSNEKPISVHIEGPQFSTNSTWDRVQIINEPNVMAAIFTKDEVDDEDEEHVNIGDVK